MCTGGGRYTPHALLVSPADRRPGGDRRRQHPERATLLRASWRDDHRCRVGGQDSVRYSSADRPLPNRRTLRPGSHCDWWLGDLACDHRLPEARRLCDGLRALDVSYVPRRCLGGPAASRRSCRCRGGRVARRVLACGGVGDLDWPHARRRPGTLVLACCGICLGVQSGDERWAFRHGAVQICAECPLRTFLDFWHVPRSLCGVDRRRCHGRRCGGAHGELADRDRLGRRRPRRARLGRGPRGCDCRMDDL